MVVKNLKKTILLVEDEVIIALSTKKNLVKYNYIIITTNTGEKAVSIIKENKEIDLILMDIDLGSGIDGTEAAELILRNKDIPIIFMSSHTEPEIVEKTEKITSYGYVVKGLSLTVLDTSIKMAFKLFEAKKIIDENNERFSKVFYNQHTPMTITDIVTGERIDANKSLLQLLGFSKEEYLNGNAYKNIIWVDSELQKKVVKKLNRERYVSNLSLDVYTKSGEIKNLIGNFSMVEVGEKNLAIISFIDITENKKIKENLYIEKNNLKNTFEIMDDGIYIINKQYDLQYVNPTLIDDFGSYTGRKCYEYFHSRNEVCPWCKNSEVFEGETARSHSYSPVTGKSYDVIELPFTNYDKSISKMRMFHDITEHKKTEQTLRDRESLLTAFTSALPDVAIIYNVDGTYVDILSSRENLLFAPSEKLVGNNIYDVLPKKNAGDIHRVIKKTITTKKSQVYEYKLILQGNETWFQARTSLMEKTEPGENLVIWLAHNISERIKAQDEVKQQLLEKEIILKETHHRIKNNIASIGSLLSLQIRLTNNTEAKSILQNATGRIESMQIIYEKLLLTNKYTNISVKEYLFSLIDEIMNLFPNKEKPEINKKIDDFFLDTKYLIPLGIIVNELLTNIMKYAFTKQTSRLVEIGVTETKGKVSLIIQDNGKGLPDGFDLINSDGFGLMLIKMLSQQLYGTFAFENDNGAKSTLEFVIQE